MEIESLSPQATRPNILAPTRPSLLSQIACTQKIGIIGARKPRPVPFPDSTASGIDKAYRKLKRTDQLMTTAISADGQIVSTLHFTRDGIYAGFENVITTKVQLRRSRGI